MYKSYSEYLREVFPDFKVQKISVNAGFTCPNRDGTIGVGGCSYCNNTSFTPSYCMRNSGVAQQIEAGKKFFARKYPDMRFLVYFQSYTNTYGRSLNDLEQMWTQAVAHENVVGLIISTRPDCLPKDVVSLLGKIARRVPVFVEIGAETAKDETLARVCRNHTWRDVCDAVERGAAEGLRVGLHLIAGLPGDSREDVLSSVRSACRLSIESLKLHHLQIIRSTPLFEQWSRGEFSLLFERADDYLNFCAEVVDVVPEDICIERFLASAPPEMVAAPRWGLKNFEFVNALNNLLREKNVI